MKQSLWKLASVLLLTALLSLSAFAEDEQTEEAAASGKPVAHVYFRNVENGSANAIPGEVSTIRARVVYEGCEKGKEYKLALRLEDLASGTVCKLANGNVGIMRDFTAEETAGFFEFDFQVDAAKYPGKTLVENHSFDGTESQFTAAPGADAGRIYIPEMKSDALSEAGGKTLPAGKNAVIYDVISYYGLAPGEEYRIITRLQDRLTGELLCGADGKTVSASSWFSPAESEGQIAVKITADLRDYGDRAITLLESVYILPKEGMASRLLSNEADSEEDRTVFARLSEIHVYDEMYGMPIPGAELRVISRTDGFVFEGVTDENGKCDFPLGSGEACTCMVVSVPDEYHPSSEAVEFTPSEVEGESSLNLYLLRKTTIVIKRTDAETGLPLQGVTMDVRDPEGKLLSCIVSDADGKARFDAGAYWDEAAAAARQAGENSFVVTLSFSDRATPSEYFPREDAWTITIDEKKNCIGLTELPSVKRVLITMAVVDRKGNGLPGVELSILNEEGVIQGRAVTDHGGRIYFTPQRTGKYYIVEDKIPPGYSHPLGRKQITIEENGDIRGTLTIVNLPEDFTGNVAIVAVLTGIVAYICFSVGINLKNVIQKKVQTGTGKHE